MFHLPLLEFISSLDHNGFTVIALWTDRTLPVRAIGSAKLYVVGVPVTICKFGFGALRTTFYQLIS